MKKILPLLITLISVAVCSLLFFTSIDQKIADYFQRALPPLNEKDNILMINVDDSSVENIGTWPFSRDVYAQMIALKEFGIEGEPKNTRHKNPARAKRQHDCKISAEAIH